MTTVVDTYELSPMQAGMLFHVLSRGRQGADTEQTAIFLPAPIDEATFIAAWQRVIDRHTVLRTRFRWERTAEPVQEVVDHARIPVESFDWRNLPEAERDLKFRALVDRDRDEGFDLREAPLVRLKIMRAAKNEHWILSTNHHSIYDGRGRVLVLQEVFAFYEAFSRGEDLDIPPPRPYRDYIEWLRTVDEESSKAYWQKALAGFGAPTSPTVSAPEHPPGDATIVHRGSQERRLSAALSDALKERARDAKVTLNTLVQGAWALLLHRYCGERDVVFGATRACRRSALGGAENIVGLFINTLPLRVQVDPDAELMLWLQQLRAQQVELRGYEHTPLVLVQSWSEVPRGTPLFESILVFENRTLDEQMRALSGTWSNRRFIRYHGRTNFPLTVGAYGGRELFLEILYSSRFDDDIVARMLGHLQTLLEGMATRSTVKLRDLPLLTDRERRQVLAEWNDTKRDYPSDATIQELFEAEVERTPRAVALECAELELSYAELNARANQLAHYLEEQGVGPETMVGICVERGVDMVVGVLGILKAGGAYVPLDPDYPAQRLAFMLEDTGAPVLLTQARLRERLPRYGGRVVCLDSEWGEIQRESAQNPKVAGDGRSLAYVIYTSGSTGTPKGVQVTHRAVNRLVCNTDYIDIRPTDGFAQASVMSFDAATFEIWGALLHGARLVGVSREVALSPRKFSEFLRTRRITVLFLTTALFNQMAREAPGAFRCLRYMLFGGEAVDAGAVRAVLRDGPPRHLLHVYGPTEVTTFSTWHRVIELDDAATTVPIGRPIANTTAYVLDEQRQPAPVGVAGELYLGGDGLARGYLKRPELTAERFVDDPFGPEAEARLYRTGDWVRYRADGAIEFIGRRDNQVKVRGFRIELGEIEAALGRLPSVQDVVALVREDTPGDKRVVAYVVPKEGQAESLGDLRIQLKQHLPEYMVPSAFVLLEALPLTPNGKVDREALPVLERTASDEAVYVAPRTPTEEVLAAIWAEVLKLERVGVHDNFFELGGHSLLAMQVLSRIRYAFDVDLQWQSLFEAPTVEAMGASILSSHITRPQLERRAELMLKVAQLSDSEVDAMLATDPVQRGMSGHL